MKNKQIKYRIYNKETAELSSLENSDLSIVKINRLLAEDSIDVMQFTGFYDKKLNEIYEGDILTNYSHMRDGVLYSRCLVFWSSICGEWKIDESSDKYSPTKSSSLSEMLHYYEYEVVGNLYDKQ